MDSETKSASESSPEWKTKKEGIKSNAPLKFTLFLLKFLPLWFLRIIAFFAGIFFWIFAKDAKSEAARFQRQILASGKKSNLKKVNTLKTIISFALGIFEKMCGWLGKLSKKGIIYGIDDIDDYITGLENKKGAFIVVSHMGNIELLRSLATFSQLKVDHEIPVTIVMEKKSTAIFMNTLNEINPKCALNVIDPSEIGVDTIDRIQTCLDNGEIFVIAADRLQDTNSKDNIILPFLGKDAKFPYGVFFLASLINTPRTYYCYCLRTKFFSILPKYRVSMIKSKINFDCSRSERKERIKQMAKEYVDLLEKKALENPHQWYNFFDFWK